MEKSFPRRTEPEEMKRARRLALISEHRHNLNLLNLHAGRNVEFHLIESPGSIVIEALNLATDSSEVVDPAVPVTVLVEIVTLCSCFVRAEAFCVRVLACLRLSVADCDEESCPPKLAVTDPEISGIPPETVPVILNWLACCTCAVVD